MSTSEPSATVTRVPIGTGFDAVVGQNIAVAALRRAIASDRLPHTMLFHGPQGVGKATTALILAQALSCHVEGPLDACGECAACSRVVRGIHPDVLWIAPEKRVIKIEQIVPRTTKSAPPSARTAASFVGLKPHEGRRRVVVIADAHALNTDAQNAFLKTLEEPPPSAVLILTTHAPGNLLPTVTSRCQALRFAPVGQRMIRDYLSRQLQLEPAEAHLRAALTPGSIGAALDLDVEAYEALLEVVVEALRLAQHGGGGVVAGAELLVNVGLGDTALQRGASTLRVGRDVLRDLLVVTTGATDTNLVNASRRDAWVAWSNELTRDGVIEALGAVNEGIERFTRGIPPSAKMGLERTLVDVGRALSGATRRVAS